MESHIAPKITYLKRFQYWMVVPSHEHPGSCIITPIRLGITHGNELLPKERLELYDIVIPEVTMMMEGALGACSINESWRDGAYHIRPLQPDQTELPEQTALDLFQALCAAAAAA